MKAMILAGGEGTRLRPLTCDLPKPMVPVANRPCMEHIINLLKRHGITQIGVTLAYLPQMIADYFGTGEAFDVNLKYFTEEKPLGTAGCIGNAKDFLLENSTDDSFLVISGDALTDIDLTKAIGFHQEKNAMATLLLKQVEVPLEYGVVVTSSHGRIQRFVEKPSWSQVVSDQVNTGIYILSNKILSYIKEGVKTDFAKDIFPRLLEEKQPMYGCVADGYWCDIGDLTAYAQANRDALDGTVQVELPGIPFSLHSFGQVGEQGTAKQKESEKGQKEVRIGNHCQIGKNVIFTPPCLIGDHCIIGDGAHIGQYSILGNHTTIETNASIKKSILWSCAHIGKGAELRGALICQNTKVETRTRIFEHAIVGAACTVGADSLIRPRIKVWPGKEIAPGAWLNEHVIWDAPSATSHGATASASSLSPDPCTTSHGATASASSLSPDPSTTSHGATASAGSTAVAGGVGTSGTTTGGSLFGQRGICGTYGTTLTPTMLCRIGSALAASLRAGAVLSIAHDGSATAGAAALAFLGGAAAVGARCYDAGHQTLPILRYLVKEYGHQGAAFFQTEENTLYVYFLDANGCDISHKQEKQIGRLYTTCDLPPAPADLIAPVLPLHNGHELYIASMQRLLTAPTTTKDKSTAESVAKRSITVGIAGAPFVRNTAVQILQRDTVKLISFANKTAADSTNLTDITNAKTDDTEVADFSIIFCKDGEQFDLYDETGALISAERVSLLTSFLLLEHYGACTLALPVDQPMVHEWLSKQYGATLTRTGVSPQDMMERMYATAIRQQADAQLSMRYDAIYFTIQLVLWLQQQTVPLSKLLQTIPHPSMAQEDLDCSFHLKGKVMRKLAEENADSIRETADGIQIFTEKGWILILPDASRPVVHITAEGFDEEYAKELLVDFENKIHGYLQ